MFGDAGNEDGFVGVDGLAGAEEAMAVGVADIGGGDGDPIGQLALDGDVVLIRRRKRHGGGPELRIDAMQAAGRCRSR